MKLRNRCCCAPYPTVDLTEAFPSSSRKETSRIVEPPPRTAAIKDIQEQVTHACERYGCFHVTLSASKLLSQEEESSDFSILQDEKVVRKTFDSIFRHENNHDNNTDETCCSSCISSFFSSPVDGSTRAARYRGRSAESGSSSSSGMEPKQSWEIFRCRNMLPATTTTGAKNDDDQQNDLGILHQYMEVLHKVSVCLLRDVLELPYFVDSGVCQCGSNGPKKKDGYDTEQLFCSVDLLRAFQYDAVESSQVLSNLGSSPHTDWGSLTVVWQDSKGGLQIYCHEHQIWNDVEIGKDDSTSEDNGDDKNSEGFIRFFIHVGDFTSLVMNHVKDSTNGNRREEEAEDRLVWPSPLHRVLCPTLDDEDQEDGSRNNMESTRCSLVYFAYPTKGLSLEDVQKSVSDKIQEQSHHHDDVPYERFLVLNDQSKGGGDSAIMEEPEQVYQKMKSIPFHQVIQDKWKQVQR